MVDRRDVASWLEGPGSTRPSDPTAGLPGERVGLPGEGPGRVAGFGPRLVAFLADTVVCAGLAAVLAAVLVRDQFWTSAVFALEVLLLTAGAGGSAGQLVTGLRVRRLDGGRLGPWRVLVRTLMLLLLVPALIWDRDGRGLHDRVVGSAVVHTR